MKSHPIGNENLFQYYFIVQLSSNPRTISTPYPANTTISEEIYNRIIHLTQSINLFSLPDEINNLDALTYIDLVDLPDLETNEETTYFAYAYNSSCKDPLKILVSKYYHPSLMESIIKNDVYKTQPSLFLKLSNVSFIAKDPYSVLIDLPDEDIPENCALFPKKDLSQVSEISNSRRFFLSQFPPYYMYHFIFLLFKSFRIIVCSSSIQRISNTVLSISSFLYPLQKDKFLIKVIPLLSFEDRKLINTEGPCIIGVHSTILYEVLQELKPDSKYILFNTDIPYIISQPKNLICELEFGPNSDEAPNEENKGDALQKERSLTSLYNYAHRDIIHYNCQFNQIYPAFYIQARICEFIIGLTKCIFGIDQKKSLLSEIVSELENAKNKPEFESLFKSGSLFDALLYQLQNPSDFPETVKSYFPKESDTPTVTVPHLFNDFYEVYNPPTASKK